MLLFLLYSYIKFEFFKIYTLWFKKIVLIFMLTTSIIINNVYVKLGLNWLNSKIKTVIIFYKTFNFCSLKFCLIKLIKIMLDLTNYYYKKPTKIFKYFSIKRRIVRLDLTVGGERPETISCRAESCRLAHHCRVCYYKKK